MDWLSGTVALITGAGSGIGKAVAERFIVEGARVVAFDIAFERLRQLQSAHGERIACVSGDVRSAADNQAAVDCAVSRFGKLDVFVGNAGVWDGKRSLDDLSPEELSAGFDEIFAINVKGFLLGAQAARAELAKVKGCMIFTLSTSSFYVGGGGPLYVATKHATLGIMRALAFELAPDIRVNGVAPSGTLTAMADASSLAVPPQRADSPKTSQATAGKRRNNLLDISVHPEDHAAAYVLLASRQSHAMTGTVINSDGGRGVMGAQLK